MATVYERVKVIVVDKLDISEDVVVPSASFVDDLKADSLDLAELIMAFEEEFSQKKARSRYQTRKRGDRHPPKRHRLSEEPRSDGPIGYALSPSTG